MVMHTKRFHQYFAEFCRAERSSKFFAELLAKLTELSAKFAEFQQNVTNDQQSLLNKSANVAEFQQNFCRYLHLSKIQQNFAENLKRFLVCAEHPRSVEAVPPEAANYRSEPNPCMLHIKSRLFQ